MIASYYFPPDAAVGALRAARFARGLPEFGWDPFVLTAGDGQQGQVDPERTSGLEGVPVSRIDARPALRTLYWLRKRSTTPRPVGAPSSGKPETLVQRCKRYIVSLVVLLPDEHKGWVLRAAVRAVRLIRSRAIDLVITSGPPHSLHLIGLIAAVTTNARWIADFRDPWVESLAARPRKARSHLSDAIEGYMERAVLERADRVIVTTDRLKEALRGRYPSLSSNKLACVPNGIDRCMFDDEGPAEKYAVFTIAYTGSLYEGRTPEPLFQAAAELIRNGHLRPSDLCIRLLGECGSIDGIDTMEIARRHGLEAVVEVTGFVPHSAAIEVMRRSHVLLVLAPAHHRLIVPAKIYDYLGAGSAILAIAEPGATPDFITATGCGTWFPPDDVQGLRDYLRHLITNRASGPSSSTAALERYDGTFLTSQLAAEMSAVCEPFASETRPS